MYPAAPAPERVPPSTTPCSDLSLFNRGAASEDGGIQTFSQLSSARSELAAAAAAAVEAAASPPPPPPPSCPNTRV